MKSHLLHSQQVSKYGENYRDLSIPNQEASDQFCVKALGLQDLKAANIVVNVDYDVGCEYNPLYLFRNFSAQIYIGIAGNDNNKRPGRYIAGKYYGGSKETMAMDGWHTNWLLKFIEPDFENRRYTGGWGETLLQTYVDKMANTSGEWELIQAHPLLGDNVGNLPDTGVIVLYMCYKIIS